MRTIHSSSPCLRMSPFSRVEGERAPVISSSPTEDQQGSKAAISNMVVRLVSEYTGRGPTRSRTHITEDLVTVVLRDTLTKGEQSLVRDGRGTLVHDVRKAYQDTMRRELIEGIEALTGRTVEAFLSANHIDPDIAVETFLLVPIAHTPQAA